MILNAKELNKIFNDRSIKRKALRLKSLSSRDIVDYDLMSDERKEEVSEIALGLMKLFAPMILIYPSCDEQFPNDCEIYGVRGLYILFYPHDNIHKKFTNKKMALKEANETSKLFHDIWYGSA